MASAPANAGTKRSETSGRDRSGGNMRTLIERIFRAKTSQRNGHRRRVGQVSDLIQNRASFRSQQPAPASTRSRSPPQRGTGVGWRLGFLFQTVFDVEISNEVHDDHGERNAEED